MQGVLSDFVRQQIIRAHVGRCACAGCPSLQTGSGATQVPLRLLRIQELRSVVHAAEGDIESLIGGGQRYAAIWASDFSDLHAEDGIRCV